MSVRVLVVGSIVLDHVMKVDSFPKPGDSVKGSGIARFPGGKGFNQAVAAARLGANVEFAGAVGNDAAGEEMLSIMVASGIETSLINKIDNESTGAALVYVDATGQNMIGVGLGANLSFKPESAFKAAHHQFHDVLLLQGELMPEATFAAISSSQGQIILNPAPVFFLPDEIYPQINFLTPNEHEAEVLTGIPITDTREAFKAAEVLCDKGTEHIVITLGNKGAIYFTEAEQGYVEAPAVNAIDTVGAGDCFNGAFAVGIGLGWELREAVKFGVFCASQSVTKAGAQTGYPTINELPEEFSLRLYNPRSV